MSPSRQSSQGKSALILTHEAGPVPFCQGAHMPGRKLWAGGPPERKTETGALMFPEQSTQRKREGRAPRPTARPHRVKNLACARMYLLGCVFTFRPAGPLPTWSLGAGGGLIRHRMQPFVHRLPGGFECSLPARLRSTGHLLWPVSCGRCFQADVLRAACGSGGSLPATDPGRGPSDRLSPDRRARTSRVQAASYPSGLSVVTSPSCAWHCGGSVFNLTFYSNDFLSSVFTLLPSFFFLTCPCRPFFVCL